ALGSYYVWTVFVNHTTRPGPGSQLTNYAIDVYSLPNISFPRQMEFIYSNPISFAVVVANTLHAFGAYILTSFSGLLGWLYTSLPPWIPYVYIALLIAVSVLGNPRQRVSVSSRFVAGAIFALTLLMTLAAIYIGVTPVGANLIVGYQGRYLIPV